MVHFTYFGISDHQMNYYLTAKCFANFSFLNYFRCYADRKVLMICNETFNFPLLH